MMWPFSRNKEQKRAAKGEKPLKIPAGHIIAKGGELRRAVTLRDKLMANHMQQKRGHGTIYWDSVVRVVEDHYGFTK